MTIKSRIAPVPAPDVVCHDAAMRQQGVEASIGKSFRVADCQLGTVRTSTDTIPDIPRQNAVKSNPSRTVTDTSGTAAAPDVAPAIAELLAGFKAQFRYFYGQERGYFPIDAGERDDTAPTGIRFLIPSEDAPDTPNEREWCYYDPERPDLLDRAAQVALQKVEKYGNVYLTRTLFARKRATKDSAKPSRIITVEDAPEVLPIPASRVLRTSPQSRQAFYKLTEPVSTAKAEKLSKLIARVLKADKTGVNANKVLRLVGGLNTKKKCGAPFRVHVESRGSDYTYDALWQAYSALLAPEALAEVEAQSQKDRAAIRWPAAKEQQVDYWLKHIDVLMDGTMPRVFKLATQSQGHKIFGDETYIAGWKHSSGSWDASTVRWVRAMNLVRAGCTDEMAAAIIEKAEHPETIRIKGRNAVRNDIRDRVTTARETAVDRRGQRGYDLVGDFARKRQPEYDIPADGQIEQPNVGGRPTSLTADALLTFYNEHASGGVVAMTRVEVAAALRVSPVTIYRLNSELKTRGEITVKLTDDRQRSTIRLERLFKTSDETAPEMTRSEETAERIATPKSETSENAPARIVTHSGLRPPGEDAREPPAPPALVDAIRWAIVAMEKQAVNPETGEMWKGRANPDRVRGWIAEHYPTLETVELETLYPQVRKAMQAQRAARKKRDFWDGERRRVRAFEDAQLLAALWGCARRASAAEQKRPGSPWAKRCAAIFAIHDDERRRRGLAAGDGPPAAQDRPSRKAAKARMQQLANVVNGPPPAAEDIGPTQLGFVNVAEDVTWLRSAGDDTNKVRSSQPPAPAGADAAPHIPTTWSVIARLKQQRDQRQAVAP